MEYEWIEDGHRVVVAWERDSFIIQRVECPFDGSNAYCNRRRDRCVVQRFVGVFGAECNVGVVEVLGPVEIAWIGIPGISDLDDEFSGIWLTPVDDSDYRLYKLGAIASGDEEE
jgi:hypothetical protein